MDLSNEVSMYTTVTGVEETLEDIGEAAVYMNYKRI